MAVLTASPASCNTMRQQEVPRSQTTLCSTLECLMWSTPESPHTPRPFLLCSPDKNVNPEGGLGIGRWAGSKGWSQQVSLGNTERTTHWGLQKLQIRKGVGISQVSQAQWKNMRVSSKDSGVMCTWVQILPLTS